MRAEVQEFLTFLHKHSEQEIRQGVLHRDTIGMEFLTLQKKALNRCNTVHESKTINAPRVIKR